MHTLALVKGNNKWYRRHSGCREHAPLLQAIPRFCKENEIDLDPKVERLQSKSAADVAAADLVQEYMQSAGDSSVRPISQEEYLVHTLMANKRMILWDVLLAGKGLALDIAPLGTMRV